LDKRVLEAVLELAEDMPAALATIVATKGSTPRKTGAQILFYRDGRSVGTIGGGCGEAEVRWQALQVMEENRPQLLEVNLANDLAGEEGMVCGGVMTVFIEPLL